MSRTNARFARCLTLICWAAAVLPASAQHFQQIPGSLNYVSAGANEVWGFRCTKQYCLESDVYRFNFTTKKFVGAAKPPQGLLSITVGGGSAMQPDEVWALDISNIPYQYNPTTKKFDQIQVASGSLTQIAVGYGDSDNCHPYEVWGVFGPFVINPRTFRYNYCTLQFDEIQATNGGFGVPAPFAQIAVSAGDVWGIDEFSCLWHLYYVSGTNADWSAGDYSGNGNCDYLATAQQVAVGVSAMWTNDPYGDLYSWDATTLQLNPAVSPGFPIIQIAAGGDGVWIICQNASPNLLYRLIPGWGGFIFVSTPSPPTWVAVGSGAGVWAIDSSNDVYAWVRP
jgi:hypothetical protein